MELVVAIAVVGLLIGLVLAANHYSDRAMDKMGEANSLSRGVGWYAAWIGLAAVSAVLVLLLMTMSQNASQSYQPPPPHFQSR